VLFKFFKITVLTAGRLIPTASYGALGKSKIDNLLLQIMKDIYCPKIFDGKNYGLVYSTIRYI